MTMQSKANKGLVAAGLAVATLAMGCATTEMTSTWTDPSAKGAAMSKIAIVAMTKDPGLRRIAEDSAAAQMAGAQATPSYQVLGDADIKDKEAREGEAEGGRVQRRARHAARERQRAGEPVPYDTSTATTAGPGSAVYGPGYMETDTIVKVVSNMYSLDHNKLVWSGTSKTFDPSNAKEFMTDVSKAVAKSLQKDRIIL